MATSQNGWPVLDGRIGGAGPTLRKWIIPGTGRHLVLRDGSAGFLLIHLALWFHRHIQRIDGDIWDEWGWAPRPIRGSSTISNHASGTAGDLNATRHPLGVRGTFVFKVKQIVRAGKGRRPKVSQVWAYTRIRARLRGVLGGTLRWGGDYSHRVDGMHFELNVPLRRAEKHARRLARTKLGKEILDANPGARKVIFS